MSVIYLTSGAAHMPYLVTSLMGLRNRAKYDGPVEIHAWEDSYPFAKVVAEDDRLGPIEVIPRHPEYRGKNAQFWDKINLMGELKSTDEANLYLDADTVPIQDIRPLIDVGTQVGFCATQFNDWKMSSRMVQKRVERLRDRLSEYKDGPPLERFLDLTINHPNLETIPSVNGGVFACRPDSGALHWWRTITNVVKETVFIADEAAMHLLDQMMQEGSYAIRMGGEYNASPRFWKGEGDDVCIWHFHGDSNVRPNKSQRGFDIWWPMYSEALWGDWGKITSWIDAIKNKHLRRAEDQFGRPIKHLPSTQSPLPGTVDD